MSIRRLIFFLLVAIVFLLATAVSTKSNPNPDDELVAGRNVNMVSGITFPDGDPYLQRQNEPSIAVSTRNPLHLLAGANDYRSINIAMEDKLPGFEGTNQALPPDAWLGVFKSIDGGSTWKSTLLPGYLPYDTTPPGAPASPLFGFSAAADPVVRAGPNGLFFFAGIAFNREDRGDSAVFVSRFIDNNNKENVDTTAYIDTQVQDSGRPGQFIDKPWLAVDVPYQEAPRIPINLPDPDIDTQYVTRCNVYLAYSIFLGTEYKTPRTKIYFVRSTDSGETWGSPTKLTETQNINQGATIGIDPRGNGHVWVAWRRFFRLYKGEKEIFQPDAIVVVKSEDGGATFTKPFVVAELAPWFPASDEGVFDQATTAVSFRTNDYPTMAVDHNGTAYIAWTQRGLGPTGIGEARIVMTASSDGRNWTPPAQAICDEEPVNADPPGHQLMPQLTYAAGKLTLLWYDQRWDFIQIFLPFIEDIYPNVRHTIDVRAAQAEISSYPVFSPSIQVSKYPFLLYNDDVANIFMAYQLFYNKPNLPLFSLGTRPFMGDYIGIAPSPKFLSPEDPNNPTDYWIYNTNSSVPTIYHAVWTDNRDVVHPTEIPVLPGDTPDLGKYDQYNAPGEGCVNGNWTGIRNQNIYTSRISEGILAGSPGNTKPLNILRSFAVFVQNMTGAVRAFDLEIIKPSGMEAYFWQQGGTPTGTLEDVVVPPYSYVSKTILVEAYSSEYASIIINIYDADSDELVDYVTLNPDSTNPIIGDPEDMAAGNPHPRNDGETHTPHPRNYTIIDWNTEQYDPYINTIIPQYDEAAANNDGVTPYSVEVDPESPHPRNPHGRNPHPRNPHGRNFLLNPHPRNEHISDIEEDSHTTDVVWTIENTGNTTTSYSINTFETPDDLPDGVLAQLIVFKTYTTPAVDIWGTEGCQLIEQEHQEMVVNLTTPHPRNPDPTTPHPRNLGELGDVSVNVPPNGVFHVLYRYYNPYDSPEQKEFHDEGKYEEAVPEIVSDTPDTDGDIILLTPPQLLVIPPQALPDAVVDDTSYSTTIQVVGGTGTYGNWTVIDGYLPTGLSLDPDTGVIYSDPSPATAGTYTFKVQVNDFDGEGVPQQTAKKILSLRVAEPLEITPTPLPDAVFNVPYNITLVATGGFTPYTWSLDSGILPAGLFLNTSNGEISGTPTVPGDFFFTIGLTDSSNPQQSDSMPFSIRVVNPLVITTGTLYDAFKGGGYIDILNAIGGTETYTWSIISGSLPAVLALTPGTNRIEGTVDGAATDSTFTVQVTDSGSPPLFDTKELTIDVYDPPQITTCSPLPNGTVGVYYSQTLSGTGGKTPYTWSVFSGTLPPGLSLNSGTGDEISGTPTSAGTYQFQIHMTDSSNPNQTDRINFSISTELVAYYPFNGNADDASGNGNHGIVSGATLVEDSFGNPDCAYHFDGADDKITAPEIMFENINLSVSLLVKIPGGTEGTSYFIDSNGFGVWQAGDDVGLAIHLPTTNSAGGGVTNYDEWHHFVGTYDGTTIRAYINGSLVDETLWSGSPNDLDRQLTFGHFPTAGSYWNGDLDEVRIYNRALTGPEIEALYAHERSHDFQVNAQINIGEQALIAGDLRNDGIQRIVSGNYVHDESGANGYIRVYSYANGNYVEEWKKFIQPNTNGRIIPVAVGDVNNDGKNEFLVNVFRMNKLQIYQSNGEAYEMISEHNIGNDYAPAAVFDLDRDGLNELVIDDAGGISVYEYQDSSLVKVWAAGDGHCLQIAIGDPDGDGEKEAIAFLPWADPGKILVIGYDGLSYSIEATIQDFPLGGLGGGAVADFDKDGNQEMITSLFNITALEYPIYLVKYVCGNYVVQTLDNASMGMFQIHAGDIDGDGYPEASILRNSSNSFVVEYKSGSYHVLEVVHAGAGIFGDVADVDGDGKPEILSGATGIIIISDR